MKKILSLLLLLIYLAVSTGFVVSMHFCMDRFDSAQIGTSGNDKCHKCGMHKKGGCCRDEVKVVKLQVAHMASQLITPDFCLEPGPLVHPGFIAVPFITAPEETHPLIHGPPLDEGDTYLRNRVFRI